MGVPCALLVQLDYLTNRSSKNPGGERRNHLSKKQLLFLALALMIGSFFGFLVRSLAIALPSSATPVLWTVSKTITITQFTCNAINYDTDIGQFCPVDKIPLAHQPASMNCISMATSSSPSFTLSEKCDPNGSLLGNPFYVAWKSGYLELFVEDGAYNFKPPREVTYSAVV
jgi:hypothetical protein